MAVNRNHQIVFCLSWFALLERLTLSIVDETASISAVKKIRKENHYYLKKKSPLTDSRFDITLWYRMRIGILLHCDIVIQLDPAC